MTLLAGTKRLWRIRHTRCGDWSAATFIAAPVEWDEVRVEEGLRKAQDDYLAALRIAQEEAPAPNGAAQYSRPDYDAYPDKTVAEVKAEHEIKRAAYKAWEAELRRTKRTFEDFLADHGFTRLWECEDDSAEIDWGHRHGVRIDYGESSPDGFPSPAKVMGEEDDDDS